MYSIYSEYSENLSFSIHCKTKHYNLINFYLFTTRVNLHYTQLHLSHD